MFKARALSLFAMLALTTSLPDIVDYDTAGAAAQAGTWEDDCNLSRGGSASAAAHPGTPKTSQWTRTTIGFHGRACRQIA